MIPISDADHKAARFPFINIALILANIYVFFLQVTNPESFTLAYALTPSQIDLASPSTWYPFVTSMFLHGGILHIASNMLFLWVFGDNVEGEMPPLVYLFVYLASGIAGAFLQYILNPTFDIPMLGASGAVAGVLGAYISYFPHHRIKTLVPIFFVITFVNISAWMMIGYWFLLQVLSGVTTLPMEQEGGVAFFAHIGGFVAGFLLSKMFRVNRTQLA
jgi:membrane associated rhomboid family serine protease